MIPEAMRNYYSALGKHISEGEPLTLIGEVGGANKVAKVLQAGLKIVGHCAEEDMIKITPAAFSGVKRGVKAIGAARDYMSLCDGLNKCASSGEKTQKAYKTLANANKDRIDYWVIVAKGVGGVAFIGMFVGGKPFLILHTHMGINVFGTAGAIKVIYMGLAGVSSLAKVTEKALEIYQLHQNTSIQTEEYYQTLVPHSVKLASKLSALVRTTMYFGPWGSPGLNLSVLAFSALTGLLSAHIKSGEDKKE